jgi:MiaB/RimO family radical SAM methylthiotransferase
MILGQITAYAEAGASEIQITAQDVSAWGLDCGLSLDELLGGIKKIPGQFMVRVGMMNPATAKRNTDDLIEAFSDDRIFKFVHLPVQSGSDKILEKMGRGYIVAEFEDIVFRFRRRFPGITIATDLIVGFPDETETDFMMSLDLIERVRPNKVNITRYSPRPFTGLLAGKDHPDSVKKDRSRRANHHAERMYTILNKPYLGKEVPFLVTEKIRKGSVMARTPAYLGIVIYEDLPAGFEGRAILEKDHRYFFTGRRVE